MRTAIAAPSAAPGRRAEHVRVGQRVAEQALERRAGDRQRGPDEHRGQDPRQPQVHDDRLGRRRSRSGPGRARAAGGRGSRAVSPGSMADRPHPDAEDERHEQQRRAPTTADARSAGAVAAADPRERGRAGAQRLGAGDHRATASTGASDGRTSVRVDRHGERQEALDEPRPGPRHDDVVDRRDRRRS